MKDNRRAQDSRRARKAPLRDGLRGLRSEWPLLTFPVLVVMAILLVYVVNRSIERNAPVRHGRPYTWVEPSAPETGSGTSDVPTSPTETNEWPLISNRTETRADSEATARKGKPTPKTDDGMDRGTSLSAAGAPLPDDASNLEGVDRLVAVLREAAKERDHTRLKQCLDELVAMGDGAVVPLTELIAEGDPQAGVWAAEALARIGTPAATVALLDTLEQIKEGAYKEQVSKRISNISNHESWPILLDAVQDTADAVVLRAAGSALSRMADTPVIDEIVARYDASTDPTEAARLAQIVGNITSPRATEPLLALAGDVATPPQDALQRAAIDALGKIGDPQSVSYLLRKLEASPPGEGAYVFNTITGISQPQAQASLLYAAAGNKEVSADNGRAAAVQALGNYPDEKTCHLLESIIAEEENTRVATAALRALESIRKLAPHVTAKTDELTKPESGVSLPPPKK